MLYFETIIPVFRPPRAFADLIGQVRDYLRAVSPGEGQVWTHSGMTGTTYQAGYRGRFFIVDTPNGQAQIMMWWPTSQPVPAYGEQWFDQGWIDNLTLRRSDFLSKETFALIILAGMELWLNKPNTGYDWYLGGATLDLTLSEPTPQNWQVVMEAAYGPPLGPFQTTYIVYDLYEDEPAPDTPPPPVPQVVAAAAAYEATFEDAQGVRQPIRVHAILDGLALDYFNDLAAVSDARWTRATKTRPVTVTSVDAQGAPINANYRQPAAAGSNVEVKGHLRLDTAQPRVDIKLEIPAVKAELVSAGARFRTDDPIGQATWSKLRTRNGQTPVKFRSLHYIERARGRRAPRLR